MAEPTGLRRFRTTDELWAQFAAAVQAGPDPEADMSKVLRQFVRWYVGEPGAKLPERPTDQNLPSPLPSVDGIHGDIVGDGMLVEGIRHRREQHRRKVTGDD